MAAPGEVLQKDLLDAHCLRNPLTDLLPVAERHGKAQLYETPIIGGSSKTPHFWIKEVINIYNKTEIWTRHSDSSMNSVPLWCTLRDLQDIRFVTIRLISMHIFARIFSYPWTSLWFLTPPPKKKENPWLFIPPTFRRLFVYFRVFSPSVNL